MGSGSKNKVIWASALGGFAVLLIAYQLFSGPSAPVTAAQPTTTVAGKAKKSFNRSGKERDPLQERLDPTLDLRLLAQTEQTKYAGSGRNIFVAQVDIPAPVAPAVIESTGPIG